MTAAKIAPFGGMVPAVDDTLLPDRAAAHSENAWLYAGTIAGMHQAKLLRTCGLSACAKVYRIPNNYTDAVHLLDADWLEFTDPDTDVIHSPVIGDTFDRYYWASTTVQPMYNTRARIHAGSPALILGVPAPSTAPTLASTGGTGVTESRSYVVTWVTQFGEEGPPSPPVTLTGKVDDTWTLTLPVPGTGDTTGRLLSKARIYRTVVATGGTATFFFVAEVVIATTTYADTITDAIVSSNNELPSTTWSPPPTDLQGWVTMPNGMIAGFRANEVWFCEPYRPHAWPAQYAIAVDFNVVGLGVIGQTAVICTKGNPAAVTGINPSSTTQSKLTNFEPCLSRGSIISAPEGVYYASPNGLILVANGLAQNITASLITRDKWQASTNISTLRAARMGGAYYAWGSLRSGVFEIPAFENTVFEMQDFTGTRSGFLIDPANPTVAFNLLSNSTPAFNVINDAWTSEVFIIRNNSVYWIDVADIDPTYETAIWRSKVLQTPDRKNFGAMRVYFSVPDTSPALNPVRNTNLVQTLAADQWGLVRIYADNNLVMCRELRTSGELMRLPSGFKADYWQIEFETRVIIKSVQIASSAKELASV